MGRTGPIDAASAGHADPAGPVRIDRLVIGVMNRLLDFGPAGMDAALDDVLAEVGQACGLDRVFLFRSRTDGSQFNSHEWVAPGVAALKDRSQMVDPAHFAVWQAVFDAGQQVRIENRDDLPEGLPERRFLEKVGVWSTLMLPLSDGPRRIGVLGFDSQTPNRIWARDEGELLSSLGRAVTAVLMRDEAAKAVSASRNHLAATLRALPDLVIELCSDGTVMACHSDKLPWLSGLVHAGIGRHLREVLPEPLADVLSAIVADPPAPLTSHTRRVGMTTLVAPHRYEVSVAPLESTVANGGPKVGPKCGPKGGPGLLAVIRDLGAEEAPTGMASYREGQFTDRKSVV